MNVNKIKKLVILMTCCLNLTACDNLLDVDSYHVASEDKQWTSLDQTEEHLWESTD